MRSRRIDPLLERAKAREDKVAKVFAERLALQRQHEQRLDDLSRFRAEYDSPPPAEQPLSPALLRNRVAFRDKINAAVDTQKQQVTRSLETVEIERTRLLLASRDTLVLEKLRASYRAEEAYHAGRREQAAMDELAGRTRPSHDPEESS